MLIRITNTPRPYGWGSTTAIADLLGTEPSGGPEAELWLGAHPGSPARIVDGAAEADLEQWAAVHAPGGRLPFLLKVLAASAPLSLQVHPTPEQARAGFARENAAGIPLDAPHRNYRDDQHKPELIVALSDPFRAVCGFRPAAESRADLAALADSRLEPLLERLVDDGSLSEVLRWLLSGHSQVRDVVAALSERARSDRGNVAPWLDTVRVLAEHHPGDPGIAISALMHTLHLRPGEALYLPSGNLHAYVEGLGVELMAASDNVLRGGLTSKHVDVPELLRVLDARPMPVPRLEPEHPMRGVSVYNPPGVDFALVDATLSPGDERLLPTSSFSVALCIKGQVVVHGEHLERGQAAVVPAAGPQVSGDGRVLIATTT